MSLAYYTEEEKIYKTAYNIFLRNDEIDFVSNKIVRHFKIQRRPIYKIRGHKQSGEAFKENNKIHISNGPSMGLLIHELGHMFYGEGIFKAMFENLKKKDAGDHGLIFQTIVSRIHEWAQKNNYWMNQIEKRRK